jgi:hypothetical protein
MREMNKYKGIVKTSEGKTEIYMGSTVNETVETCRTAKGMVSYKVICRENGWVVASRPELNTPDPSYNPHSLRHVYNM